MTTTLQELDEVLENKEGNERDDSTYLIQLNSFDAKAGDFLRNHAPEIRAALEMREKVEALVSTAERGLDFHIPGAFYTLYEEGRMEEKKRWITLLKNAAMLKAAPPAQGEQDG